MNELSLVLPMYNPSKFKQTEWQEICHFIQTNPFATLIADTEDGLDATHIPLYWREGSSESGYLYGHFARANTIWKKAKPNQDWLVIFHDVGHYISANYYPSKKRDHKVVPTWNYQAIHLKGMMTLIDDLEKMKWILAHQTEQFESVNGWKLSDAPNNYIESQCKGIVCFELKIHSVEAKYKLNQNQSSENRQGVIEGLNTLGTPAACKMAALVNQFSPE